MRSGSPFELRVIAVMLVIIGIVSTIGVLTFRSMKNIITTVSEEGRPDKRQLLVNEVLSGLSEAENSVRTFSITRDTAYLAPFYHAALTIDGRMDSLNALPADTAYQKVLADSLGRLVEQKFGILNELLALQNDDRVKSALTRISSKLDHSTPLPVADTAAPKEAKKEKSSIFSHIFGKKKTVPPSDTIKPTAQKKTAMVPVDEVRREISRIRSEEKQLREAVTQQELELTRKDKQVMDHIREVASGWGSLEKAAGKKRTAHIEQLAGRTNVIIARFCIAAMLLLLLTAFVITSYVRKNRAYSHALHEARANAESHAQAKERFLANMSHEIRTPMNAIAGFTEQVLQSKLTAEQEEQLQIVKRSADHLLGLLNSILDLSKLDAGKLELESTVFSPGNAVKEVIQLLQPQARAKGIELSCMLQDDLPSQVKGDPVRFRQVLLNLASNAVKFTEKGVVRCTLGFVKKTDHSVLLKLEVADTGIGVAKEKLGKIFDEFEQADSSTSRKFGGTGLGLTITKKLVELQGGTIRISSLEGKGTIVWAEIPFPLAGTHELRKKKLIIQPELFKDLQVLIADDKEYNRKLAKVILDKWKVRSAEAENGEAAVEMASRLRPGLILMDVRMPVMDGLEATKRIKKQNALLPVIALTAAASAEDMEACKAAGMDQFVSKPFREEELYKAMLTALQLEGEEHTVTEAKNGEENKNGKAYDLSELKRLSNGDNAFLNDMIGLFIRTTTEGIADIEQALERKDWPAVREHAHKIAAPCKHVGADILWKQLKALEQAAESKDGKTAGVLFEQMKEESMRLTDGLQNETV